MASSGLGHIARGIETWAADTALALAGRGVEATLFAAAELPRVTSQRSKVIGERAPILEAVVIDCIRRSDPRARRLVRWTPGSLWRWGLKSEYGWEQFTFWLHLWPRLRRGRFDILHVQDPMLAWWCRKFRKLGLVKTQEILAHGTEEPVEWLAQFEYVQHLAPWHLEQALAALGEGKDRHKESRKDTKRGEACGNAGAVDGARVPASVCLGEGREKKGRGIEGPSAVGRASRRDGSGGSPLERRSTGAGEVSSCASAVQSSDRPFWVAIPNFVDTEVFHPPGGDGSRRSKVESRKSSDFFRGLGVPEDALIIGTSATVKKPHKRIDYLIREFASLLSTPTHSHTHTLPYLCIAGASHPQSEALVQLADELAPGRVKILLDLPRDQMPDFYRSLDVFVLVSLFEMVPISIMEALVSGIPVITNDIPHLRWMTGAGEESGFRFQVSGRKDNKSDSPNHPTRLQRCAQHCGQVIQSSNHSLCGGAAVDMSKEGALASLLASVADGWIRRTGIGARQRAAAMFGKDVVVEQYVSYYERVTAGAATYGE